MRLQEYQVEAAKFLIDNKEAGNLAHLGLGLAGEVSEVLEPIKKFLFYKDPKYQLDKEKLTEEIGDVLWYLSNLATALNLSMEQVGQVNIEKLKKRYNK